jgi:hypothetical protein
MRLADQLKLLGNLQNTKHNVVEHYIEKCECGNFADKVLLEVWTTQLLVIKYEITFLCEDCLMKRKLSKNK